MSNIFENAYFGKAYKTRDGNKAIYHHKRKEEHILILEAKLCAFVYNDNGYHKRPNCQTLDIISEWQEEIDEEELDGIAWCKAREEYIDDYRETYAEGFKEGYKQALNL